MNIKPPAPFDIEANLNTLQTDGITDLNSVRFRWLDVEQAA